MDNRPEEFPGALSALAAHTARTGSDFVLFPELGFSPWLAASKTPDPESWRRSVATHQRHIAELGRFGVGTAVGTRPIERTDGTFGNEAFAWTRESGAVPVHEKYYLPDEESYWEASWYDRGPKQFRSVMAGGTRIGVQICTEMWFLEWSRHYARQGVELLCVPRVTPNGTGEKWLAGGRTAAVCAGAYCLSSNLWTPQGGDVDCGGLGWVIDPEGEVLATTTVDDPFVTVDVDLDVARRAKATYPRYVRE
jgi:N-carbamoylputrescine amidase